MQKKLSLTHRIALSGALAALSIVFGKLLQIPIGDSIRISFENLPILLASLLFGPVLGGLTGLVADLVGCLLVGYSINPIITLGAVMVGVLPALLYRRTGAGALFGSVLVTHVLASMAIKTLGLYLYFYYPVFPALLLWRVPIYLLLAVLESVILYQLLRHPFFSEMRRGV